MNKSQETKHESTTKSTNNRKHLKGTTFSGLSTDFNQNQLQPAPIVIETQNKKNQPK